MCAGNGAVHAMGCSWWSKNSHSIMWVPEIRLRILDLAESDFTPEPSYEAEPINP